MERIKKFLSLLLVFVMVFGMLPSVNALLAAELSSYTGVTSFAEGNKNLIIDASSTKITYTYAGDIVFVFDDANRPGMPRHVFICASSNLGGNVYLRYDHGSNARIKCVNGTEVTAGRQPCREVITGFYYAYRPCSDKMPNT